MRLVLALEARGGGGAGARGASLEELSGVGSSAVGSTPEYSTGTAFPGDPRASGVGGFVGLDRLLETRRRNPRIVIQAAEQKLREDLGRLPGEPISWLAWAREDLVPQVRTYHTLSRVLVMVAGAIDEGRVRGAECQHAMLLHIMRVLEDAARREGHDLGPCYPLLGLPDPVLGQEVGLAPIERSVLAAYHRDRSALASALGGGDRSRGRGGGGDAAAGSPQPAPVPKPKAVPKPKPTPKPKGPAAKAASAARTAAAAESGGSSGGG